MAKRFGIYEVFPEGEMLLIEGGFSSEGAANRYFEKEYANDSEFASSVLKVLVQK